MTTLAVQVEAVAAEGGIPRPSGPAREAFPRHRFLS